MSRNQFEFSVAEVVTLVRLVAQAIEPERATNAETRSLIHKCKAVNEAPRGTVWVTK